MAKLHSHNFIVTAIYTVSGELNMTQADIAFFNAYDRNEFTDDITITKENILMVTPDGETYRHNEIPDEWYNNWSKVN